MPKFMERTPLTVGATYSWWFEVALAPASAFGSGGPIAAQTHSGTYVAQPGDCGRDVIDTVMGVLAKQMGRHRDHITLLRFDIRS